MRFKKWLESANPGLGMDQEGELITLNLAQLIISRNSLFAAHNNISRGSLSKTTGPIDVLFVEPDKYQVIDGYHRVYVALLLKKLQIEAKVYKGYSDYFAIAKGFDRFKYKPEAEYSGLESLADKNILKRIKRAVTHI